MQVTLIRQVSNDLVYWMPWVALVLPPLPGTSVAVGDRMFPVERYTQLAVPAGCVPPRPLVYLAEDPNGYWIETQCDVLEKLGFSIRSDG